MTRKEALERAIEIIEALDSSEKTDDNNDELINVLKELKQDYPYWKLTGETIIDMVEQYRIDHNGLPHVCDFNGKELPSPSVIKRIFRVEKISDFLDDVFPKRNSEDNLMYNGRSHSEWLEEFKTMFLKFEEASLSFRAKDYERNRAEEAPALKLFYRWFGITGYNQLLELCGLKEKCHINVSIVNAEDASADKMEDIITTINDINKAEK